MLFSRMSVLSRKTPVRGMPRLSSIRVVARMPAPPRSQQWLLAMTARSICMSRMASATAAGGAEARISRIGPFLAQRGLEVYDCQIGLPRKPRHMTERSGVVISAAGRACSRYLRYMLHQIPQSHDPYSTRGGLRGRMLRSAGSGLRGITYEVERGHCRCRHYDYGCNVFQGCHHCQMYEKK